MKTTTLVSHPGMRLMWAGVLIAALLMAGCTSVVTCPGCQPQCASGTGSEGEPVTCVPVDLVVNDPSGCTSGQKCSSGTANQSCPFSMSKTKCRTLPYPGGPAGKCYCTCAT